MVGRGSEPSGGPRGEGVGARSDEEPVPDGEFLAPGAEAGWDEMPVPHRDSRAPGADAESDEMPVPGVRGLEHTADVGLEVEAPDLPELFRRAALGTTWLVLEGEVGEGAGESRILELAEEDLPSLLRSWLRYLLFWQDTEGFAVTDASVAFRPVPLCSSPDGQAFGLRARVEGRVHPGPWVREIKGVTLHGLEAVRRGEGWYGRVIFDV
jgi:SHS2 domain-containing protein